MTGFEQENLPTHAYQRLAEDLRMALFEGRFKVGERMPTEAELAEMYGVHRQTVRRAFHDLVADGLVARIPGRGTFPTNFATRGHYVRSIGNIEDLQAFVGTEMELLQQIELRSDEEAAGRLGLQSKVIAAIALRRLYEGVPFGFTHVYLPPSLGLRLAESESLPTKGPGTVIGALAKLIPETIAALIDYEADQPCLRAERTYFDTTGTPVEVAVSFYNPNHYVYRLQMRRRTT